MKVIVSHEFPVPAPPGDPIALVEPNGWHRFSTPAAVAYVHEIEHERFVLHWIESDLRGHGSAVLAAIGRWADALRLTGALLCERDLCRFYEHDGWTISTRPSWADEPYTSMVRWPIIAGRPVIDVATELV